MGLGPRVSSSALDRISMLFRLRFPYDLDTILIRLLDTKIVFRLAAHTISMQFQYDLGTTAHTYPCTLPIHCKYGAQYDFNTVLDTTCNTILIAVEDHCDIGYYKL